MANCFVSYTGEDEPWAKWIAAVLRDAGHSVSIQAIDFRPGENFVIRMQEAASSADHTLVVLSNRYLASAFGASEWASAFASDPTGAGRRLIPIAVEPVTVTGLLRAIIRIELFGKSEHEARQLLQEAVAPSNAGSEVPFPTDSLPAGPNRPDFSRSQQGGPQAVEVWRLPTSSSILVGREEELGILRDSWNGSSP